ncbi:hypothetical protein M8C21_011666 [Ambrosia artemisiifolia]|uniref:Uncharacterized protein n=1 Tax=Ambrosia artemisiifolia TaxID=4212 RepID=A0AAD5D4W6_AMBAR|nr:hypothetical protein M8C21_011666 [Ambrosia artemisiifolia]
MVGREVLENSFSNLNLFNGQDQATIVPSKFDSVMSPALAFDSIPSNTKFRKSPVSRPVRHSGPPPGFHNPKHRNEDPALDDYSWLDGYQVPYAGSYSNDGFGNSFNCLPQPNKLLNTSKTSLGMECFPFPGKQVSTTVPANIGNGNGWLDYQIPEHSSLQQESVKTGNEQFLAVPQQYQGHSLWEGRFFVLNTSTKVDDVECDLVPSFPYWMIEIVGEQFGKLAGFLWDCNMKGNDFRKPTPTVYLYVLRSLSSCLKLMGTIDVCIIVISALQHLQSKSFGNSEIFNADVWHYHFCFAT